MSLPDLVGSACGTATARRPARACLDPQPARKAASDVRIGAPFAQGGAGEAVHPDDLRICPKTCVSLSNLLYMTWNRDRESAARPAHRIVGFLQLARFARQKLVAGLEGIHCAQSHGSSCLQTRIVVIQLRLQMRSFTTIISYFWGGG